MAVDAKTPNYWSKVLTVLTSRGMFSRFLNPSGPIDTQYVRVNCMMIEEVDEVHRLACLELRGGNHLAAYCSPPPSARWPTSPVPSLWSCATKPGCAAFTNRTTTCFSACASNASPNRPRPSRCHHRPPQKAWCRLIACPARLKVRVCKTNREVGQTIVFRRLSPRSSVASEAAGSAKSSMRQLKRPPDARFVMQNRQHSKPSPPAIWPAARKQTGTAKSCRQDG